MEYFFVIKINALYFLYMMSQFEIKPTNIKCNRPLTSLKRKNQKKKQRHIPQISTLPVEMMFFLQKVEKEKEKNLD